MSDGPVRVRAVAEVGDAATPAADPTPPRDENERYFIATQRQLIWRAFKRHRLALISSLALLVLYLTMAFAEFLGPYEPFERNRDALHHPPTRIHLFHEGRFIGPFVYRYEQTLDMATLRRNYAEDTSEPYPIRLLHRGSPYRMWGLFEGDLHLFGADEPGRVYLLGTDDLGRDMFSRITQASRISLSIGLVGVALSFLLGATLGAVSKTVDRLRGPWVRIPPSPPHALRKEGT